MKILAIRGKNLASLEGEFAIDFRKEPLCSPGIFAITGATGSGKSTLLDAMCISLYNNSPRINKVTDSADIYDVKEATIKEKDCRNILRRGTADGYAETEFLAIDGKEYRACWSVRRSRNKADGKLQDYSYSLFNITDNCNLSGTKTELLEDVRKLIGLTYEQFTRAVLLAQGDFATFLKASSREKAEILEKLTGTEIYSHISQMIYEKFKQAEIELKNIEERIKETALLDTEEIAALEKEKANFINERKASEKELIQVQEKIKWLERFLQLSKEAEEAKNILYNEKEKLNKMQSSIELLKKIEEIQPIRDTYIKILSIKRDIKLYKESLQEYTNSQEKEKKVLAEIENELRKQTERQNILSKEWMCIQPKIREAMKLETERKNTQSKIIEIENNIKQEKETYNKTEGNYKEINSSIENFQKELHENSAWLNKNHTLERIVNKVEILCSHIEEIENAQQHIKEKEELYKTAIALQKKHELLLEEEKKECERLGSTLTTEIATLRSKLVEGEPCPVCGSRHHETELTTANVLKEEILLKAKKDNADRIEHLNRSIELEKSESIQLQSSLKGYKNICDTKTAIAIEILNILPQYSTLTNEETNLTELKATVISIKNAVAEFQKRKENTTRYNEQLSVELNKKKNCEEKLEDSKSALKNLEEQLNKFNREFKEYNSEIEKLIGTDCSAEEKEKIFTKKTEETNRMVTECSDRHNSQILLYEKIKQKIETIKANSDKAEKEFSTCKEEIEKFLSSQKNITTLEELHKTATIAPEEITAIRESIQEIKNKILTAQTKLEERKRNIEEHKNELIQPLTNETNTVLNNNATQLKDKIEKLLGETTRIDVILKNNEKNITLSQKLHNEHKIAEENTTGWKKLNDLLGSADGKKFRVIAQGYTLDILLSYSNKHLKELSSRYELARTSTDSLAIKVIDHDMLSESRSVHSLSGGESFLVSLALALALSSLSSNRMSIESLFIDEGFGSLDSETLRVAMDALDRLQSQGRKIGVISHLTDMIERIPAKIRIVKGNSGKSRIVIE